MNEKGLLPIGLTSRKESGPESLRVEYKFFPPIESKKNGKISLSNQYHTFRPPKKYKNK